MIPTQPLGKVQHMNTTPNDEHYLYDAVLTAIDHPNKVLVFSVTRDTHRVPVTSTTYWELGVVGRLRLPTAECDFAFHVYADIRLRRTPELDDSSIHQWGWRLGERRFTVQAGILPGRGGAVVRRDTEPLTLELPREYLTFCADCGLSPATVLRGFIADLCNLFNWTDCPREDDYSNNGSDERAMAKQYFRRAYGWVFDPDYIERLKSAPVRRSPHV